MAETILIPVRFVHFAAAMLLFGASLFPAYAGTQPRSPRRGFAALAVAALLSGLAWFEFEAVSISGDMAGWRSAAIIGKVLHHTQFGHVWQWHMALLVVLVGACCLRNTALWIVAALSGASVLTLAGTGHGAMGTGNAVWLHLGNQAVHMLSASVWIGGLIPLLRLVRQWPSEEALHQALLRFSAMGMIVVCLIVATGLVNSWYLVGSTGALLASPYGLVLTAKLACVAVMILLALLNRFILLKTGSRSWLVRSIVAETVLAITVVALVSWLGTMMPPFGM